MNRQKKAYISIRILAYLLRLIVVALYWSACSLEIVTVAILCQIACDILDAIIDSEIVQPLVRASCCYVLRRWQGVKQLFSNVRTEIGTLHRYILREWRRFKRLFSTVRIEIRITISIGDAE